MARRTFRVSRYGLTACPGCGTHMKVDPGDWKSTVCPFCDAELLATEARSPRVGGRAGMLAAGFLSLTLAACDDGGTESDVGVDTPDTQVDGMMVDDDAGPDMGDEVDMGPVEPDMGDEVDMEPAPEFGIQPEYGKPPDDFGVEDDMAVEADMEVAPDFGGAPEYGGPPPDMDAGPTEDMAVLPPYGIPPMEDSGTPSTEDMETDSAVAVPLYGIPPQEE